MKDIQNPGAGPDQAPENELGYEVRMLRHLLKEQIRYNSEIEHKNLDLVNKNSVLTNTCEELAAKLGIRSKEAFLTRDDSETDQGFSLELDMLKAKVSSAILKSIVSPLENELNFVKKQLSEAHALLQIAPYKPLLKLPEIAEDDPNSSEGSVEAGSSGLHAHNTTNAQNTPNPLNSLNFVTNPGISTGINPVTNPLISSTPYFSTNPFNPSLNTFNNSSTAGTFKPNTNPLNTFNPSVNTLNNSSTAGTFNPNTNPTNTINPSVNPFNNSSNAGTFNSSVNPFNPPADSTYPLEKTFNIDKLNSDLNSFNPLDPINQLTDGNFSNNTQQNNQINQGNNIQQNNQMNKINNQLINQNKNGCDIVDLIRRLEEAEIFIIALIRKNSQILEEKDKLQEQINELNNKLERERAAHVDLKSTWQKANEEFIIQSVNLQDEIQRLRETYNSQNTGSVADADESSPVKTNIKEIASKDAILMNAELSRLRQQCINEQQKINDLDLAMKMFMNEVRDQIFKCETECISLDSILFGIQNEIVRQQTGDS